MALVDMKAGVVGLDAVIAGFWKVKGSTAAKVERALTKAGEFLLEQSKRLVPIEHGDLIDSGYVKVNGRGFTTRITVGYKAKYALWVHERIEMKLKGKTRYSGMGVYWGRPLPPFGQAKFLETPARVLQPQIRKIIYGEFMKI